MYVPYVKPVEWDLIWIGVGCLGVAGLAVLLGFSKLGDDGDA